MMKIKNIGPVAHVTSVHKRYDIRIYYKQCRKLAAEGYGTTLIVSDGLGDEIVDDVNILDVGPSKSRIERMSVVIWRLYKKVLIGKYRIVHFHDPELLILAVLLRVKGYIIVYDAHEDISQQVNQKNYIPSPLRALMPIFLNLFEYCVFRIPNAIVCATDYIHSRYSRINKNCILVRNVPDINSITVNKSKDTKNKYICYIGGLTKNRGISELVKAMSYTDPGVQLILCGNFESEEYFHEVSSLHGWTKVLYHGFVEREDIVRLLNVSHVGIVILHKKKNYMDGIPVKMYEYMAAGLPIIASDFPLWIQLFDDAQCGINVDPYSELDIAKKINILMNNTSLRIRYGEAGRNYVEKNNWDMEANKLLKMYAKFSE